MSVIEERRPNRKETAGDRWRRAGWRVASWLFPAPCLGCGRLLEPAPSPLALCRCCRGKLERPDRPCPRCGRPRCPSICGACRKRSPAIAGFVAGWEYRPPLDAVVRALKFRRLEFLAAGLAEGLLLRLGAPGEPSAEWDVDAVVGVPLHWRRRVERGFNQAEALASPVARALGRPRLRLLRRARATPPQTSLGREERLRSPAGAFVARRPGTVRGARILLVDDVATTGATLDAAARALRRAGARDVYGAVVARTP